jgi:two-component system sensor histidine kinase ChvG
MSKPQTSLQVIAPRPLSRLTYKIMSLNLLAVFILVLGIAYLDQYREGLTNAERETLSAETQLYAAVLAESAYGENRFDSEAASNILNTFVAQKKQQLHLFSPQADIVLERKTMGLASPAEKPNPVNKLPGAIGRTIESGFAKLVDLFAVRFNLPTYPVFSNADYARFSDVADAVDGIMSLSAWKGPNGELILSAATPIRKGNDIVGLILVTRNDTNIESTFANTRLDILKLFLVALTITIALSLYLSGVIGHPLRQLASAAEAIREGRSQAIEIPDLSDRDDEIGELSLAMRQMTLALRHRLDSIERFSADVSHELKNPLTSMRSAIETLQKVKSENDRQRLSEIILHDLQRMDRLITDISQASRLDTELSRDVLNPVDLRDILLPMIDTHRKPLERSSESTESQLSTIHFTGLGSPVMVIGHKIRLTQVFQNLISNALSFSPENHPIQIRVEQAPDRVQVTIEDDGPGIPESKLEKVFERFYSERPSTEDFGTHSGLGLSIAKQIIDSHNGSIKAENRIDSQGNKLGARFIVSLKTPRI